MAASFIPPGSSVIDVGCGRMQLVEHLPEGCQYTPADLTQWTEGVQRIDLDNGLFPTGRYDYCVILGVLEYLKNPDDTLAWARSACDHLIVSYCHPLSGNIRDRRRRLWINDYSKSDLRDLLHEAGWAQETAQIYETKPDFEQIVYSCTPDT